MSDPGANAYHRRNARRWRAHPFARASDALEAKIVEMKARHLREALEVHADMLRSPHRDGYDIRARTYLDAYSLRAVLGSPAGHVALVGKAVKDLAMTIIGKLVDESAIGINPGNLRPRNSL